MAIYQFGFLGIKYWSGDTYISAINQSGQQSGVRRGGKTGMDKTERERAHGFCWAIKYGWLGQARPLVFLK